MTKPNKTEIEKALLKGSLSPAHGIDSMRGGAAASFIRSIPVSSRSVNARGLAAYLAERPLLADDAGSTVANCLRQALIELEDASLVQLPVLPPLLGETSAFTAYSAKLSESTRLVLSNASTRHRATSTGVFVLADLFFQLHKDIGDFQAIRRGFSTALSKLCGAAHAHGPLTWGAASRNLRNIVYLAIANSGKERP
jgi:hypothetical protein